MKILDSIAMVGSSQIGLSGAYDCHVYAVRGSRGVVLIDAGAGTARDRIAGHVNRDFLGMKVLGILLTHAHAGHAAGAPWNCVSISTARYIPRQSAGPHSRLATKRDPGLPGRATWEPTRERSG